MWIRTFLFAGVVSALLVSTGVFAQAPQFWSGREIQGPPARLALTPWMGWLPLTRTSSHHSLMLELGV